MSPPTLPPSYTPKRLQALHALTLGAQQYGRGRPVCTFMASTLVAAGLARYEGAYAVAITQAGRDALVAWAGSGVCAGQSA